MKISTLIALFIICFELRSSLAGDSIGTKGGGGSIVFSFKQAAFSMAKVLEGRSKLYIDDMTLNDKQEKLAVFYTKNRNSWIETLESFSTNEIVEESSKNLYEDDRPVAAKVSPIDKPEIVLINSKLIYKLNGLSKNEWMALSFHEAGHFIMPVHDNETHKKFDQLSSILLTDLIEEKLSYKEITSKPFWSFLTLSSDGRTLLTRFTNKIKIEDMLLGIIIYKDLDLSKIIRKRSQDLMFLINYGLSKELIIWDIYTGISHQLKVPLADYDCNSCSKTIIKNNQLHFTGYNKEENITYLNIYNFKTKKFETEQVLGKWQYLNEENYLFSMDSGYLNIYDRLKRTVVFSHKTRAILNFYSTSIIHKDKIYINFKGNDGNKFYILNTSKDQLDVQQGSVFQLGNDLYLRDDLLIKKLEGTDFENTEIILRKHSKIQLNSNFLIEEWGKKLVIQKGMKNETKIQIPFNESCEYNIFHTERGTVIIFTNFNQVVPKLIYMDIN